MAAQIDRTTLSLILSGRTAALDLDSFASDDWALLVKKAEAEGVAPLVYRELSSSGHLSACPKHLQKALRAMYYGTRLNNEQIIKELAILVDLFDQAGILVIALKGVCFALTIYPDLGLRPMVDLDLLVPASRLSDAVRIARTSGYVESIPEAFPGVDALLSHAIGLQKSIAPYTALELHGSLVAEKSFSYAVPVDWFWTQTEPLLAPGRRPDLEHLFMLTPTAQLLYACAHAMLQHGARNSSLRWFFDLDCLIRFHSGEIDWDLLLFQAGTFEWGSALSAALSHTVALFNTPIPNWVLEHLANVSDRNAQWIAAYKETPATHTLEEYQKWKSLDWPGRVRMALALIVPSPAYMRWRYGLKSSLWMPAYYVYRWWGILNDVLRTAVVSIRNLVFRAGRRNAIRQILQ